MKEHILQSLADLNPLVYIFILAMLPLFEARYAVIVAYILHKKTGDVPWFEALSLSMIGNIMAVIPVMYLLPVIDRLMRKWQWTTRIMDFFLNRARKRKDLIDKYGFWGLTVFVAIPLPVTGAWTGTLMSYVFNISYGRTILALVCGVLIATIAMTLASYGGIEWLSVFLPAVKM